MKHLKPRRHADRERGQTMTIVLIVLGLFLLGAIGLAVDVSNWWFHRQMAQSAADAACTAGVMDMLRNAEGSGPVGNFPAGSPPGGYWCSSAGGAASAACKYAALNGYNGSGRLAGQPSNDVQISFPGSAAGVSLCGPATPPPCAPSATSFIQVNVFDRTQATFTGLLTGSRTTDIAASAVCAVINAQSPIPILVLDPQSPNVSPRAAAFNIQGTPLVKIYGGPSRSIQVNSSMFATSCGQSNCAVNSPWGSSALVDLSQGGPNLTGSDIGLTGSPPGPPQLSNFNGGTTGSWFSSQLPIDDPFKSMCAPGQTGCPIINGFSPPPIPGAPLPPAGLAGCTSVPCDVGYTVHGCPDTAGCQLYTAGHYTSAINVGPGGGGGGGGGSGVTAIFDSGLYYLDDGLNLNSLSIVRPGNDGGTTYAGATFYFAGSSSVSVASNSGSRTTNIDNFLAGSALCPTGVLPGNLTATTAITGNILLGPCSGYYGDPLGAAEPSTIGEQRGMLFFQDRSAQNVNPNWGGGGQFLLAGNMYFHSCNASGTGISCGAAGTYYNDMFTLQGNSGSTTYVLGDIVTDNLTLGGTSGITMDLNPASASNILKASLVQ
jgi:Putative Flp pilus-assembly TadE/G-like